VLIGPEASRSEYNRPFLKICPLCGGAVRWQGFNAHRGHARWRQQLAEMATG
jgi:hypothetical protein